MATVKEVYDTEAEAIKAEAIQIELDAAQACRDQARDSFERSDTDGFMSQWASGLTARQHDLQATILKHDGKAKFPCLIKGRRVVNAKLILTKFGSSWLLADKEAETFGRRFLPFGPNSRIQKSLGIRQGMRMFPARAIMRGSLACNVAVVAIRTDQDDWSPSS